MKRGFTLVELLVVTVVIVMLMAVAFRGSIRGVDAQRRSETLSRLQKLENCLSGYYAAYGSYPPVPLHGSRDFTLKANECGIQKIYDDEHWPAGKLNEKDKDGNYIYWPSVKAACRSQPVAFECPFPVSQAQEIAALIYDAQGDFSTAYDDLGFLEEKWRNGDSRWEDVQLFKLGLLSFLMPRLVIMFNGCEKNDKLFELLDVQKQWLDNSDMPVNFETGQPYASWEKAAQDLAGNENLWRLMLQPSQVECARWIENLEGIVQCTPLRKDGVLARDHNIAEEKNEEWLPLYGVKIRDPITGDNETLRAREGDKKTGARSIKTLEWYSTPGNGPQSTTGTKYALRYTTVVDVFGEEGSPYAGMEFFYYSPAPYQTYILWSSGPDRHTFPQWVTDEDLKGMNDNDLETAQNWMADDIVHMKN